MPIPKQILIHMSTAQTYARGAHYFHDNRVHIIGEREGRLEANVAGSHRHPYRVRLKLSKDGNRLVDCECDCPAYYEYDGICKHIVAAILAFQDGYDNNMVARSDKNAVLMLNQYIQAVADSAADRREGRAALEPVLEYDEQLNYSLFFRVGEQRMYIVPDLPLFAERLRGRVSASYGKYTLWHSPAAFNANSRPLVAFFMDRFDQNNAIHNPGAQRWYYGYGRNKRNMYLSPAMADEFFNLPDCGKLAVRDSQKRMGAVTVKREDYRPRLRLQKTAGGAVLDTADRFLPIAGDRGLHILTDYHVYCCGAPFTGACEDLLRALNKNGWKLFFAERELGVLFSAVLPRIRPFVDLETEGELEAFHPLPLETKIYLDTPEADIVTARMTFTYGDKTIDAFGDKDVAVSQDLAGELVAENLLTAYFGDVVYDGGALRIENDPGAVYRLITEGLDKLAEIGEVYASEGFGRIKLHPPAAVTVGVRVDAGLLRMEFGLEGIDLSELPEILASHRAKKKYHRLRDGSFLMMDGTALSGLVELADGLDLTDKQLTRGHAELAASRTLYLDAICKKNEELRLDRDQAFGHILRNMKDVENADFPVPGELRKVLRNYQKTGFRWLKTVAACGFGGILADDMGLGKTLQVLALLRSYQEEAGKGASANETLPSIVVCPSSLSLNWESEAGKFTPQLRVGVISGTAEERGALIAGARGNDLLITSYDLLKRDIERYEGIPFAFIIIDEAQYIKNQATQNAKAVKALSGRFRFALTGTPVENSLAELWSIFDFLMPGYLFSYRRFKKRYEEPIVKNGSGEASERLKQLARPFLLRRLKQDVLKELPPKTETILRSEMESEQKALYASTLASVQEELREQTGLGEENRMAVLAALTRLRQICCDPALVYEDYSGGSAKLDGCVTLVEGCVASGRRILLFSQFTSMLDILEKRLAEMGLRWLRIDGSTKPNRRLELVNTFNAGDIPVFLISLKAGGTGLNLTGADVVIHYDPWWNLSAQNQATDRAHRIGQKKWVQVYKLIAKDTIEERILEMQRKKADLADAVITESDNPLARLRGEELIALLNG